MPLFWSLLAVPFLIALNAFFVVAEYAIVAVRTGQIEQLRVRRPRAAASVAALKQRMSPAIGTIQICITMTNLLLGSIGEPAMTRMILAIVGGVVAGPTMHGISVALSFVVVTLLTVVLSELVPKAVTLRYTLPLAALTARPILLIQKIFAPLVWLMEAMANATTVMLGLGRVDLVGETVTAEELKHIATEAADSGNLTTRERSLVLNSLTFGRRAASEIMVPRVRVMHLDIRRTMHENFAAISSYLFSRMPLCDGGMDHVIGVIYTKEFLTAYQETDDASVLLLIAHKPVFVPVRLPLDAVLQRFHDERVHMLFLVDEHGGAAGVVTLTDVVSELLGPMHEGDDERIISRSDDGLIVKGEMPIAHLADHLNKPGWPGATEMRSVGGLVVSQFGRVPVEGEEVEIEGVLLRCHKCSKRLVDEVFVSIAPLLAAAEDHVVLKNPDHPT
jgi:CBS domain containing-hemolysin-like protein